MQRKGVDGNIKEDRKRISAPGNLHGRNRPHAFIEHEITTWYLVR
jgi:hypothetical protein